MPTREERIKREQGRRLATAREAAGYRSARAAALENEWAESTYRAHENGTRTIGRDDAERYAKRFAALGAQITAQDILFAPADEDEEIGSTRTVPILGYIGGGAEVSTDFGGDLGTVDLPFSVPPEIGGLQVKGDSMLPTHEDGDVVLVWKDQRYATDDYLGEQVAVRTDDGRAFLKRLLRGVRRGRYSLESSNARLIEDVRIEWVGEIYVTVKLGQLHRIRARARSRQKRQAASHREMGEDELPLDKAS